MKRSAHSLVGIVALVFYAMSAQAQFASTLAGELANLSLDSLLRIEVLGASRFAQPLSNTPAAVTVITEDELRRQGYRNIAEALGSVRGVYTSNDRNYTYLGVRGFNRPGDYNTRVLLLSDGARRNDALYDQAFVGNESPIELDWVKRLEFVAGPASAVYGANALFGIVNAVMLEGADLNGTRISVDAGSGHRTRIGVVTGQRLTGDRDWFLGVSVQDAKGQDHYYPEYGSSITNGNALGVDGEKYQKAYAKLRWGAWRFTGSFASRDKAIPTAPFQTAFGVPGTRTLDQQALLELAYEDRLGPDWQQQFRIFNGAYRYNGDYRYADAADNRDHGRARWLGTDYRLTWTGMPAHLLLLGVEGQWNTQLLQRNFDVDPSMVYLNRDEPSHTLGIFAQDEWRFHAHWLLNLGLRADKHSDYSAIVSPRFALIYQPDANVALKALASGAYRPPNAYERYYDDGGILQKSNADLQPERIRSAELAADIDIGNGVRVGASAYYNVMQNLIDQVPSPADGLLVFANVPQIRSRGVEVDFERKWVGGQRLRGSVSWQRSRMSDGMTLVNSPRMLGKLVFGLPLAAGLNVTGEWQGMSARRTLAGITPGFGIFNLAVSSTRLAPAGEVSLGFYNLGNRRYSDPASSAHLQDTIEQDRRQFRLRWTISL